jgi:succinoglycan biosynthesis transport protein ExoP
MERHTATSGPDESVVRRSIDILQRRWPVALGVFAAVLAAAVAFAMYLPDLYRTSAVVLIERKLPEAFVQNVASDDLESRLHVIKREILSRSRLTELITRFNLYGDLRARGDMDAVLDQMRQDITVEPTGPELINGRTKTVAFNLTYTGANRETVSDVTNAIAAFYVAQNTQMRSEEAQNAAQFLKTQLDDARVQLDKHEQNVRAFTARNSGQLPEQVEVNLASLERLNTELRVNGERQLRLLDQREKLIDAPVLPAPLKPGASSPAAVRLERAKLELQEARAQWFDNHPDVRRLTQEVKTLEQDVQARAAAAPPDTARTATAAQARPSLRTVEGVDAEIEVLKREAAALRQSVAATERRLDGVPYRQTEFAPISREQHAAKELYTSLLKRYEEAQLATSLETANQGERFRILELAAAPPGPSAPNRPRLVVMGVLIALLFAGVAVLLMEQLDRSFHSVEDLRAFTRVPVLAAIPSIGVPPSHRWVRAAATATSVIAGLLLIGALAAYMARGNEQLVRLLFHRA